MSIYCRIGGKEVVVRVGLLSLSDSFSRSRALGTQHYMSKTIKQKKSDSFHRDMDINLFINHNRHFILGYSANAPAKKLAI